MATGNRPPPKYPKIIRNTERQSEVVHGSVDAHHFSFTWLVRGNTWKVKKRWGGVFSTESHSEFVISSYSLTEV
eukprot:6488573-Amphidinium_carterae.1